MTAFVLDNSVTAAWCFEDQSTPYTEAVLQAVTSGANGIVPVIWRLEIVNALVVAERRKKISKEKSMKFLSDLQQLFITVDIEGLDHVFDEVFNYGRNYQRSAYDASYLELAKRLSLPFATKDEPLKNTATKLGIPLFSP